MPEEVKFNKEEMDKVQDIQRGYVDIQNRFGQLKLSRIVLDKSETELEKSLKELQNNEKTFLDGITEKYGEGTLDPTSGVFTPNENKSE